MYPHIHISYHMTQKTKESNRKAIIIGASSGIGREVTKLLIADGWTVGIAARRKENLESLRDMETTDDNGMKSGKIHISSIDVNSEESVSKLHDLIRSIGGVDLFFYSAGIGKQNIMLDKDTELSTVNTNCMGFCSMIGCAYRYMASHGGGHIASITSIAGTKGLGAAPAYSATKAFQTTYLEALSQQANLRKLNIRFTDIRPGFVATPLLGDSNHYPLLMPVEKVARIIVKAVYDKKEIKIVDWKWHIITFFWKLIPSAIWKKMNICK